MKGCTLTSEDIFKGSNIDILEDTSDKKDAKDCLKVFHFLFYFLKKWLSLCFMKEMAEDAQDVDFFSSVLSMSWYCIFYPA